MSECRRWERSIARGRRSARAHPPRAGDSRCRRAWPSRYAVGGRIFEKNYPADAAHVAHRLEILLPLLDRPEPLAEGLGHARARGRSRVGGLAEVREVVLVQDHAVVLEAEPARHLGELRILA